MKPARDDKQIQLREAQAVRLELDRWLQDARRIPPPTPPPGPASPATPPASSRPGRCAPRRGPGHSPAPPRSSPAPRNSTPATTRPLATHRVDATATRAWAAMVLAATPGANPTLANLAVLAQIVRTVTALADAHHAAGELHRQQDLTRLTVTELDTSTANSPPPTRLAGAPRSRQPTPGTRRGRASARAHFGSAARTGRAPPAGCIASCWAGGRAPVPRAAGQTSRTRPTPLSVTGWRRVP